MIYQIEPNELAYIHKYLRVERKELELAECVVCSAKTSGSLEFCRIHYNLYKEEIKGKKPWVRALKNEAQRERRRREREFDDISLDAIADRQFEKGRY